MMFMGMECLGCNVKNEHRTLNIEHRIWEPLSVRLGLMLAGARGGCIFEHRKGSDHFILISLLLYILKIFVTYVVVGESPPYGMLFHVLCIIKNLTI
jgi:hypothetical protein